MHPVPATLPCLIIADDDRPSAESLARILAPHGYEIRLAHSAEQARRVASEVMPQLLISDIYMPGNHELELLQWEEIRSGRLPVILMTAQPGLETAIGAVRGPVVDYLIKPVDPAYLLMCVQNALAGQAARARAASTAAEVGRLAQALASQLGPPQADAGQAAEPPPVPVPGMDPRLAALSGAEFESLSRRERQVAAEFVQRGSLPAASRVLGISPNTARGHLASIFRKLGLRSQVELLAKLATGTAAPASRSRAASE